MDYSPGQPLTEEQRQQLSAVLEQEQPADFGFEARYTWTLPLLAEWIQHEFGQTISVRGISVMLKRMNLSFTKATYTYAKANEKVQAYFRKHTFGLSASWGTTSTEESKKISHPHHPHDMSKKDVLLPTMDIYLPISKTNRGIVNFPISIIPSENRR